MADRLIVPVLHCVGVFFLQQAPRKSVETSSIKYCPNSSIVKPRGWPGGRVRCTRNNYGSNFMLM
jgi:hypothetical protein